MSLPFQKPNKLMQARPNGLAGRTSYPLKNKNKTK